MGLFDRLRSIFANDRLPGEDRKAYNMARDIPSLLNLLMENETVNEIALRKVKADISKLELTEKATIASIKRGTTTGRGVRMALQSVQRMRHQLSQCELKSDVLNKNLNININLRGKIEIMQAMEMRGVNQNLIDAMIMEFNANVEGYKEAVIDPDNLVEQSGSLSLSSKEQQELAALELEILGRNEHFNLGKKAGRELPTELDDDEFIRSLTESETILREMGSIDDGIPPTDEDLPNDEAPPTLVE